MRTLMIVSADPAAAAQLQSNHDADRACDPTYDDNRQRWHLPLGAPVVSNQGNFVRNR
jgi:hypothetical protein